MDQQHHNLYLEFDCLTWRGFRQDTPMTLTEADLQELRGQNENVSLQEVEEVYLPLARLLNLYVRASQKLYQVSGQFLANPTPKMPYIIAVAGSVAVGKSTTSRILQALLSKWPDHPRVAWITTDGFLYSNAVLEKKQIMDKKGFPQSYDLRALIQLLYDLKAGKQHLTVPLYSHRLYDIIADETNLINQPDIVIIEGLNVLQVSGRSSQHKHRLYVSDFFDFTIYVDAETETIKKWFLDRFMDFREQASDDAAAFLHQFSNKTAAESLAFAENIWSVINEKNLVENILPYKHRARLILEKDQDHSIKRVLLRKL